MTFRTPGFRCGAKDARSKSPFVGPRLVGAEVSGYALAEIRGDENNNENKKKSKVSISASVFS